MNIQDRLFQMQDIKYRDFQAKLTPTVPAERFIGVRTPELRAFAKEINGTKAAEDFLKVLPHKYYDENNLHGFLICLIKDYDEAISQTERFLPYVDNWATCDLMSPKVFKKHISELYEKIKEWTKSKDTYTIRFGIEMLMSFYLDGNFTKEILEIPAAIKSEEYYVNMMIAWFYATALAKQYDATLPYIKDCRLDKWTHNKAIQKAIESRRITEEQKEYLRSLKIK